MFIDTHTHLYSEEFAQDRDAMIQRASDANIKHFCIPSIDRSYANRMHELEKKYPDMMHLMMGLHPCSVKPETFEQELKFVEEELARRRFVAVGEIGVDMYWERSTLSIQQEAFQIQIQWAKKYNLPINIHCRDAFDEVFQILDKEKDDHLFGIFHCFTGTYEQAQQAIDYGMKLGIGGVVTFKNGKIDQFLNQIPIEHIVLETDAPYLAPVPYRGKRNESSYIPLVAQKLAEIYGVPISDISKKTTENAKNVYKL